MSTKKTPLGRALTLAAAACLAAGCASGRSDDGERAGTEDATDERRASDTAWYPGTADEGGTGVGGAGAPQDPTATDTAGEYGDPNAWPTGPLPGDTGVGGAGTPIPDTVWIDTLSPEEGFDAPDEGEPGAGGQPGGGTGPDVW